MDYAKFIENLVKPLVLNTEDVQVTQFLDDEELITVQVKVNPDDLFYVMALTAFTLTIAIWVPTPGGAGGVEVAFSLLYSPFIASYGFDDSKSYALAIMLIWRMLTYYLLIIYGFVLYLIFEKRDKISNNTNIDSEITVTGKEN